MLHYAKLAREFQLLSVSLFLGILSDEVFSIKFVEHKKETFVPLKDLVIFRYFVIPYYYSIWMTNGCASTFCCCDFHKYVFSNVFFTKIDKKILQFNHVR